MIQHGEALLTTRNHCSSFYMSRIIVAIFGIWLVISRFDAYPVKNLRSFIQHLRSFRQLRGLELAVHSIFTHPRLINTEPPKTTHAFLNVNYSEQVLRFSVSLLLKSWSLFGGHLLPPRIVFLIDFRIHFKYSPDCTTLYGL